MYNQVFSRLLWKDGTGKANPDLAESWQVAPDNLSITLKLRDNLKWHDGKAVAAQDFVDMFGYLSDEALAKDLSIMKIKGIMGPVKEVSAPDASTVKLSFSAPVPYITDILDYWFLIRIDDKTDPAFVKKLPSRHRAVQDGRVGAAAVRAIHQVRRTTGTRTCRRWTSSCSGG